MNSVAAKSVSWELDQNAPVKHEEPVSWGKFLGTGVLMGAALLPSLSGEAAQPDRPDTQAAAVRVENDQQHAAYIKFASYEQVPQLIKRDTHVYVSQGSLPISEVQLRELDAKLSGTNYYLVILGDLGSQSKLEQAKVFLGQKVFDAPEFAQVVDNRLGEATPSGCLFVLTFNPRDWFMSTSQMHEQNGVKDEIDWGQGRNLGHIAREHFRNGRFSRGVGETVDAINNTFNQNVNHRIEQQTELKTGAALSIRGAGEILTEYQARLNEINTRYPDRTGDLIHPLDIAQLSERIETAQRAEAISDYRQAREVGDAVKREVNERIQSLVEYPGAGTRLEGLTKELAQAKGDFFASVLPREVKDAEAKLGEAQALWQRGAGNYTGALRSASEHISSLRTALETKSRNFDLDGEKIQQLSNQNAELMKSPYASAGEPYFQANRDKIESAHKLWSGRNLSYAEPLQEAAAGVSKAALEINNAEEAAARAAMHWNIFYGLMGLGTAVASAGAYVTNRRVRNDKDSAEEKLSKLELAMKEKQKGVESLEQLKARALTNEGVPLTFTPGSKTEASAKAAVDALEKLWLFQIVVNQEVTSQAKASIAKGGILSSQNYQDAIDILDNKKVEFSARNRKQVQEAFSKRVSGLGSLSVSLEELQNFSRSLKEIDAEHMKLAKTATENLQDILSARGKVGSYVATSDELITKLTSQASTLSEYARGDKQAPKVFDFAEQIGKIAGLAGKQLEKVKGLQAGDPIEARSQIQPLERALSEVTTVLDSVIQKRNSAVPSIRAVEHQLIESGLAPGWINTELQAISQSTSDFLEEIIKIVKANERLDEMPKVNLEDWFKTLHLRIDKAAALNTRRSGELNTLISSTTTLIAETRDEVAQALKLKIQSVLCEDDANPDDHVNEAISHLATLGSTLEDGDIDSAFEAATAVEKAIATAKEIISDSKIVVENRGAVVAKLDSLHAEFERVLPEKHEQLASMQERFSRKALQFTADDAVKDEADNTVENNVREAEEALAQAAEAKKVSANHFAAAKVLRSARDLDDAQSRYDFIDNRLVELDGKDKKLTDLSAENGARLEAMDSKFSTLKKTIDEDNHVSASTQNQLEDDGAKLLETVKGKSAEQPNDPQRISELLDTLQETLVAVEKGVESDRTAYSEARESFQHAGNSLEKALKLSSSIEKDEYLDSRKTDKAQEALEQLKIRFVDAKKRLGESVRGDWEAFISEFDQITASVAKAVTTISEEYEILRDAVKKLEEANSTVHKASRWSGRHGYTIDGNPGSRLLRSAKEYLANGEYASVAQYASRAYSEANNAIESAEAKVRAYDARIAAEEAAAEAARQAARRAASYRSSSSSSWSSGSSSSFGGFGSGGSSISFGGGGSGGSSVGW